MSEVPLHGSIVECSHEHVDVHAHPQSTGVGEGWRVEGGGWRVEGWRVEGGGWKVGGHLTRAPTTHTPHPR